MREASLVLQQFPEVYEVMTERLDGSERSSFSHLRLNREPNPSMQTRGHWVQKQMRMIYSDINALSGHH